VQNFFDHFFALGGLLVPIVAIVVGGVMGIIKMVHAHEERLAKIERGMDPDAPWQQPPQQQQQR
jgi:hypothetical protein